MISKAKSGAKSEETSSRLLIIALCCIREGRRDSEERSDKL